MPCFFLFLFFFFSFLIYFLATFSSFHSSIYFEEFEKTIEEAFLAPRSSDTLNCIILTTNYAHSYENYCKKLLSKQFESLLAKKS